MIRASLILIIASFVQLPAILAQLNTGIEEIVEKHCYVVHSEMLEGDILRSTANIYLLKGTQDSVWVFGCGFGSPEDIRFYKNNDQLNTSGVMKDAHLVDSIISSIFNLQKQNVILQFVVPHFHLDHINQEFLLALEEDFSFDLSHSNIYIHYNDLHGATCGMPCCGDTPCKKRNSDYFGAPYSMEWENRFINKFKTYGDGSESCNDYLFNIQTEYGEWEVLKADVQHTSGAINLVNRDLTLKIQGSAIGTECDTPDDWDILHAHGNARLRHGVRHITTTNNLENIITGEISIEIVHNWLKIHSTKQNLEGSLLEIYNSQGQLLEKESLSGYFNSIQLHLPHSLYYAVIRNSDGRPIKRESFVVE